MKCIGAGTPVRTNWCFGVGIRGWDVMRVQAQGSEGAVLVRMRGTSKVRR